MSALSAFNRDWKVEKLQVGSYNHAWELDTKPEHHISLDGSPSISWDVSKFLNTIFSLSTTLCMNNLLENFCEGKHQVVFLSQARQQTNAQIWICWEKCEDERNGMLWNMFVFETVNFESKPPTSLQKFPW